MGTPAAAVRRGHTECRETRTGESHKIALPASACVGDEAVGSSGIVSEKRAAHFRADLEVCRTDSRSQPGDHPCGVDGESLHRGFEHSRCEPAPAGMYGGNR